MAYHDNTNAGRQPAGTGRRQPLERMGWSSVLQASPFLHRP
ncbi:hypothetical protein [Mesorhizobium silamurunense]|nr:hypothetical protein [Mesorhizobium silamurunense]